MSLRGRGIGQVRELVRCPEQRRGQDGGWESGGSPEGVSVSLRG